VGLARAHSHPRPRGRHGAAARDTQLLRLRELGTEPDRDPEQLLRLRA
jgi:hypothetical protein